MNNYFPLPVSPFFIFYSFIHFAADLLWKNSREKGQFHLLSLLFTFSSIKRLLLIDSFVRWFHRVCRRAQLLQIRIPFSCNIMNMDQDILSQMEIPSLSPASLRDLWEHHRCHIWPLSSRELRRADFPPVTAHGMCGSERHQEFGFICLPIQTYLSQTVFSAALLGWFYRSDSDQIRWSLEKKDTLPHQAVCLAYIRSPQSALILSGREGSCKSSR